jgi:hypothetical protein
LRRYLPVHGYRGVLLDFSRIFSLLLLFLKTSNHFFSHFYVSVWLLMTGASLVSLVRSIMNAPLMTISGLPTYLLPFVLLILCVVYKYIVYHHAYLYSLPGSVFAAQFILLFVSYQKIEMNLDGV